MTEKYILHGDLLLCIYRVKASNTNDGSKFNALIGVWVDFNINEDDGYSEAIKEFKRIVESTYSNNESFDPGAVLINKIKRVWDYDNFDDLIIKGVPSGSTIVEK